MKNKSVEQTMQRIRRLESEMAFASPKRAAKLTSELVRLKATVFD